MVDSLVDDIEKRIDKFVSGLPAVERELYASILTEIKEFSLYSDGTIKNNLENIKRLGRIKRQMDSIVLNDAYLKDVSDFIGAYSSVEKTMNVYFSKLSSDFTPKKVLEEVKKQAINDAVEMLTENGISTNISTPLSNLIKTNVTNGGSYAQLTEQLRESILGTPDADGSLTKYAKTYATDAVNGYSGTYMKMVTDDLGLNWFRYVGSLIKTSRPFCVAMVKKSYVHKSEFAEILKGNIDGVKVSLSGVNKNTTPDNFQQLRGGWQCGHQLIPISEESVPESVKNKLNAEAKAKQDIPLTPKQKEEFNNFEKDGSLSESDARLQDLSIKKFITEKDELTAKYLKDNGNIINTDEARKQFIDIGYNGTNASGVHEASSALSKEALKKLIAEGKTNHVSFYAGGAGAGKTSAIEGLLPHIKASSDAIIDGNLASYSSAMKKVDSLLASGKSIDIIYVYRDAEDAWSGVISRMLNNKAEMGRTVKMSTFLENTEGSYNTIRKMLDTGLDNLENVDIKIIDNSLGRGKAAFMNRSKFNSITYNRESLRRSLLETTEELYKSGKITKEQYEVLIQ